MYTVCDVQVITFGTRALLDSRAGIVNHYASSNNGRSRDKPFLFVAERLYTTVSEVMHFYNWYCRRPIVCV
jgi:hypothetical protein